LLQRLAQQLDIYGRSHDLAPQREIMGLSDHKPQLPGQTWFELEEGSEEA
jgi:hypothetical protein